MPAGGRWRRIRDRLRAESPGRAAQIDGEVKDEGWESAAVFASYCCQCEALDLRPWQDPPCFAEIRPDSDSLALLVKLLGHGLSRFDPDPVAALARARRASPVAPKG
jgi:hypothetical protein